MIDYLQLVKAERKFTNRASEVGMISKAIKELAMDKELTVKNVSGTVNVSKITSDSVSYDGVSGAFTVVSNEVIENTEGGLANCDMYIMNIFMASMGING